jgi:hypothetical protein
MKEMIFVAGHLVLRWGKKEVFLSEEGFFVIQLAL